MKSKYFQLIAIIGAIVISGIFIRNKSNKLEKLSILQTFSDPANWDTLQLRFNFDQAHEAIKFAEIRSKVGKSETNCAQIPIGVEFGPTLQLAAGTFNQKIVLVKIDFDLKMIEGPCSDLMVVYSLGKDGEFFAYNNPTLSLPTPEKINEWNHYHFEFSKTPEEVIELDPQELIVFLQSPSKANHVLIDNLQLTLTQLPLNL